MIKIGFIGPPGVGKTTTAQHFASKLRFKTLKKVELIDEYARRFVSLFKEANIFDQYLIANKQIDKENLFINNTDYLITDSPAFLGEIYSRFNINWKNEKEIYFLNEIIKLLYLNYHSYDYLFYFKPIKNNKSLIDGKRIHIDENIIFKINDFIISFLLLNKIDFIEINGNLNDRVDKCIKLIKEL